MKKALAVLLSFIIGLLPLCALGEVSDTILIDTSFTLRENQSEHIDESIWLYYCMYTADVFVQRGLPMDSLLDQMESSRVYYSEKTESSDGVTLHFNDHFALEFVTDADDLIQEAKFITSCPVHGINYVCKLDLENTYGTLLEQLRMPLPAVHQYASVNKDDGMNACLSSSHDGLSSTMQSMIRCLQAVYHYADDPQHAESIIASELNQMPYQKGTDSYYELIYQQSPIEISIYMWKVLELTLPNIPNSDCNLGLMILFDKDGNPMNISLGISPPHLQDLFESPYLYDPSAFNDGGYYETTGALHSPSIVLQSTPDWIYSENK